MYDDLEELADLSENLQSNSITLPKAHKLIVREIDVLRARKNDGVVATKYTEAQQAVECGEMYGVPCTPYKPCSLLGRRLAPH